MHGRASPWLSMVLAAWACKPPVAVEPLARAEGAAVEAPAPEEVSPQVAMLETLRAEDPRAGLARYVLARYYAPRDRERALELLGELLVIDGWDYALFPDDFPALVDDPDFEALADQAAARAPVVEHGPVAFELDALDLLPEGVAWDPARSELLLGSAYQGAVLAADDRGTTRTVIEPGRGGLRAVLGIAVDAGRDRLWVTSNGMPMLQGFDAQAHGGPPEILCFQLPAGEPVGRWPAPEAGSLLNDLIALSDGSVLVTDSAAGTVLRKAPELPSESPLQPLVPAETFFAPNGLVELADESAIVVADFHGLHHVTLADGSVRPLIAPKGVVTLGGIDGLERSGSTLVGIQNLIG